jgi:Zn finger protein HypA/HybF involved in hydrogenase expression
MLPGRGAESGVTVVDLEAERLARAAHASGAARCLDCGHEWAAVAPTGTEWLQCPACSLVRGRFVFPHLREVPHWHCACGNDLFQIVPAGVYCPNCGTWQTGWDRPPLGPVA